MRARMNVATQAIPTIYGVTSTTKRAKNPNGRSYSPWVMSKARKVVVKIIWMIMVMSPMMPPATETLRVAERLR